MTFLPIQICLFDDTLANSFRPRKLRVTWSLAVDPSFDSVCQPTAAEHDVAFRLPWAAKMDTVAKGTLIPVMSKLEAVHVILTYFLTCLVGVDFGLGVKTAVVPFVESVWKHVSDEFVEEFGKC